MPWTELAMDRAEATAFGFVEHARAVRSDRENRRSAVGESTIADEKRPFNRSAAEVNRQLLERRLFDRNRPSCRTAGAPVAAAVVRVHAQALGFVFHFAAFRLQKSRDHQWKIRETS
jgi:hypothetical protein